MITFPDQKAGEQVSPSPPFPERDPRFKAMHCYEVIREARTPRVRCPCPEPCCRGTAATAAALSPREENGRRAGTAPCPRKTTSPEQNRGFPQVKPRDDRAEVPRPDHAAEGGAQNRLSTLESSGGSAPAARLPPAGPRRPAWQPGGTEPNPRRGGGRRPEPTSPPACPRLLPAAGTPPPAASRARGAPRILRRRRWWWWWRRGGGRGGQGGGRPSPPLCSATQLPAVGAGGDGGGQGAAPAGADGPAAGERARGNPKGWRALEVRGWVVPCVF